MDLEKDAKMNIGMQKFMTQENDFRKINELINQAETAFNDLGGEISNFLFHIFTLHFNGIFQFINSILNLIY